ncbi:hypothetical protein GUJ93_ZPchr0001g30708 [Zizania palustris]|uniref:Uncharacterized protein n=1 Tax=Zizania palustris TaxID=103762 RepID=A0A8J5VDV3_ZIZPA|nr:hypothetical protein GUJ93_ZPchr0001g30708 [Zizania palustris]
MRPMVTGNTLDDRFFYAADAYSVHPNLRSSSTAVYMRRALACGTSLALRTDTRSCVAREREEAAHDDHRIEEMDVVPLEQEIDVGVEIVQTKYGPCSEMDVIATLAMGTIVDELLGPESMEQASGTGIMAPTPCSQHVQSRRFPPPMAVCLACSSPRPTTSHGSVT